MAVLLNISRLIDWLNEQIGKTVYWLILIAVLVSSVNATIRYSLNTSSNAWLELQWYLFAAVFLLSAGYTLLRNEHIRIDIVIGRFSPRVRTWVDILGGIFFLLPMAILIFWMSWPMVMESYRIQEMSTDAGGLIRWPVKLLVPVGFGLLILQGFSEIVKRVGFLMGKCEDPAAKFCAHGNLPDEQDIKAELEGLTTEKRP
ncbi:MAG: TRAP transporter small permease subunit [Alphaproteobacteria bacterium]|nr:TRAP transporter small permease subunit [Alphaproteobacteria bacterium]